MTATVKLSTMQKYSPILLSNWCREYGLVHSTDYTWHFLHMRQELIFTFYGDAEQYASLFALRWAKNDAI